jgi:hypothetical protein
MAANQPIDEEGMGSVNTPPLEVDYVLVHLVKQRLQDAINGNYATNGEKEKLITALDIMNDKLNKGLLGPNNFYPVPVILSLVEAKKPNSHGGKRSHCKRKRTRRSRKRTRRSRRSRRTRTRR